ncbi:MAG: MarR family winged helix-turn-helix transcriptional regulator [Caulobacter sp.]|nr:MarR family winged helix-turn-helix transcriptional regulator [Caulobacter sp.]MDP1964952.1 MarR family winged helix-turn-helix transcriptional regulator [Reyranella sp.]
MTDAPIFYKLLKTAQRRVERWVEAEAGKRDGLSAAQGGLALYLGRCDGAAIGDAAEALDVAPSAMTGLVDRMTRAGLVERRPDPKDGRGQRLHLTDRGWAVRNDAVEQLDHLNDRMGEDLSAEDARVVARWLDSIADKFSREDQT